MKSTSPADQTEYAKRLLSGLGETGLYLSGCLSGVPHVRVHKETLVESRAEKGRQHLRAGIGQPEPGQAEPGEEEAQRDEENHGPHHRQQRAFQSLAHRLEEDGENERGDHGDEAQSDEAEAHLADLHHQLVGGKDSEHRPGNHLEAEDAKQHQSHAKEDGRA